MDRQTQHDLIGPVHLTCLIRISSNDLGLPQCLTWDDQFHVDDLGPHLDDHGIWGSDYLNGIESVTCSKLANVSKTDF